jgi:2-succinyl-5-enolpyruvyl-6-hydroxy-3-cyclohexene-1-carboxylate synthase
MREIEFFEHYAEETDEPKVGHLHKCLAYLDDIRKEVPDLPFSNIWIASKMAHRIPDGSAIHFGILSSLRAWNFYELPPNGTGMANVGGFGIDGGVSSLIGASFSNKDKLYYGVIGDLAFFYDMNALGNRHVGHNVRLLLVNNGKGTEFKHSFQPAASFGDAADTFVAAEGHFGNKSRTLVKNFAGDLGYEYISASNKQEFEEVYERFLKNEATDRSIVFEVFTNDKEEARALDLVCDLRKDAKNEMKMLARQALGAKGVGALKKVMKR